MHGGGMQKQKQRHALPLPSPPPWLQVWDLPGCVLRHSLEQAAKVVYCLAITQDSSTLLAGGLSPHVIEVGGWEG